MHESFYEFINRQRSICKSAQAFRIIRLTSDEGRLLLYLIQFLCLFAGGNTRWQNTLRSKPSLLNSQSSWDWSESRRAAFIHNCICQSSDGQKDFLFPLNPSCTSLGLFYADGLYRWKKRFVFNLDGLISSKFIHHLSIFTNIYIYIYI